jgi:hypothetical protein
MRKQLVVACLTIATLGVIPSLASALPVVTHPTGTVLATGTKITATNVGTSTLSNGLGSITCSTAILTGTLETNTTAAGIKGTITSAKFGGTTGKTITGDEEPECTGTGFYAGGAGLTTKPPYCIESIEANDTFKMRGGKCSEAPTKPKFQVSVTTIFGTVTCIYETEKANLSGTFETDGSGSDVKTSLSEQAFVKSSGSGGECPSSGKLSLTTTSETDSGTAEPVYVSS